MYEQALYFLLDEHAFENPLNLVKTICAYSASLNPHQADQVINAFFLPTGILKDFAQYDAYSAQEYLLDHKPTRADLEQLYVINLLMISGFLGISLYNAIKHTSKLYAKDFYILGVKYTNQLTLDQTMNWKGYDFKECEYYYDNDQELEELAEKWENQISNGYIAPLYVAYINPEIGHGTFADCDIKAGDFIGSYTGKVTNCRKLSNHQASYG